MAPASLNFASAFDNHCASKDINQATGGVPMPGVTRRDALRAFAAVSATGFAGVCRTFARAAEFSLKYGNNLPLTHPLNIRAQEAADRIFAGVQGPRRNQDLPEQSAGRRHRHAGAGAQRRHRLLHAVGAGRRHAGARRGDQCRRLRLRRLQAGVEARWTASSAPTCATRWPRCACTPSRRCGTTASARRPPATSRSRRAKDMNGLKIRVPVSPLSYLHVQGAGCVAHQPAVQ